MNLDLSQSEAIEIETALFQQLRLLESQLDFAKNQGKRINQANWQQRKRNTWSAIKKIQAQKSVTGK